MTTLPEPARALLESGALGHVITINRDGTPQVSVVWVGLDGDDVLFGATADKQKIKNLRRDPRVVVSFEAAEPNAIGLREYLVIHGRATVEDHGYPELIERLREVYTKGDPRYPRTDLRRPDAPPACVARIRVERVSGYGPWNPRQ
ncbi:MAG: PPOX class F420-dependent oxidoreductase [Dehalococcoidia bacterium]